jgi:PAS domain S-box-containing protein
MPNSVSRAVMEVLLDRVNQGAATLSPEATLVYANQRLASMLGRTRAHLVGMPLPELVAAADREKLDEALSNGRDTAAQCRLTLVRPNGNGELQALLTFAPLGHGQASCLVTDLAQSRVRNMVEGIRAALEPLKRISLPPEARRALETIEQEILSAKE